MNDIMQEAIIRLQDKADQYNMLMEQCVSRGRYDEGHSYKMMRQGVQDAIRILEQVVYVQSSHE